MQERELHDVTLPLVRCPKCGLQLDIGVPICPNDGTRVLQTPEVGELFQNKYVFVERLAAGGMGTVYKAKQQGLDRFVAIKVMSNVNATPNSIRRFQQEAQALAMLHHQGLVQVYELGVTPFGQPYTVMEYVDGQGLDAVLAERKHFSLNKIFNVFLQVCDGLAYVHESGVLHRDLKPSNIMLVDPFDENPKVKLVDFGIAKIMDSSSQKGLTQTGEVMGSPHYMSPEQAKGQPVDVRSDIYSLGCVMYETLTGIAPFQGASVVEVILKQVSEKHRSINSVVRGIKYPNALEALIDKMLEKDPNDRYSSVKEVQRDLSKLASEHRVWYHVSIVALKRGTQDPLVMFGMIAATALIVVGSSAWIVMNMTEKRQQRDTVVRLEPPAEKDLFEKASSSLLEEPGEKKKPERLQPSEKSDDGHVAKTSGQLIRAAQDTFSLHSKGEQNMLSPHYWIVESPDEHIDFQAFPLPERAFTWFADRKLRYITSIIACNQPAVDDASIPYIENFPLLELRLGKTKITRASLPAITKIHTLSILDLSGLKLSNQDVRQILSLKQLNELYLEDCGLTDESLRILTSGNHALRRLNVSGNKGIDDAGLATIALNEPSLVYLDIGSTAINDKGVLALAGLPYLQFLLLGSNHLTDKSLAYLERCHGLRMLDMRWTDITDRGLAATKFPDLCGLRIGHCRGVNGSSLPQFSAHNPNCNVRLDQK